MDAVAARNQKLKAEILKPEFTIRGHEHPELDTKGSETASLDYTETKLFSRKITKTLTQ